MSDRLNLDIDLDMDLDDTGPEEQQDAALAAWDEDLLEDFPADDPAAFDGLMKATDRSAGLYRETRADRKGKTARPTKKAGKAKKAGKSGKTAQEQPLALDSEKVAPQVYRLRRKTGVGPGIGLFVGLLVILGGLMLGAGVLIATGSTPLAMLDFSGLQSVSALGDLDRHPVNAFWVSLLVVLLAASLATVGVGRRLKVLQERLARQTDLLAAVTALDPEVAESWRQEILLADADISAVTGNLLGHYHLQQAKLSRYVGLEGELHRLEKAMAEESLNDLQGNWENPGAGSLADQAARLVTDRNGKVKNAADRMQLLSSGGTDLASGLRDARVWQASSLDQVNQQGVIAERISRQLAKLAANSGRNDDIGHRQERIIQAVSVVKDDLAALPEGSGGGCHPAEAGSMAAVTDRASRIAFQIAMEVARLGPKGERLLPLTQDLENLTTELRAQIDNYRNQEGDIEARDQFIDKLRGCFAELDTKGAHPSLFADLGEFLSELAPQACEGAAGLAKLSQHFGVQAARLKQLNELVCEMTGIEIEELDDRSLASESGLHVDRHDPFAAQSELPGGLVADPFTSSRGSIFDATDTGDRDFAHQILPGKEDCLLGPSTAEPSVLDLSTLEDQAERLVEPGLSLQEEKVYDLAEFGAQLLPSDPASDETAEGVYDLSEFGAVRIA